LFEDGGYGLSFGQIKAGEMIFAIRGGGGADFEECSGGGLTIPGLSDSPIVDADEVDYIVGIRDGCTVLVEVEPCVPEEPSGSVSGSEVVSEGPEEPLEPEEP
jgi:hypothetical protein